MGSLVEYKGIVNLLEVFNGIKNSKIELHIAGKGDLLNVIENFTKIDSRIQYHGFVMKEQKESLLRECDVLIFPSICFETFGLVVIDAYQYGLPVIANSVGGVREIVDSGKTGLLIEAENSTALKEGILAYIDCDNKTSMFKHMFNKLHDFSLSDNINSYERIYASVLQVNENDS